jgi:uncharacterized protein with FMN-binding domain
MKRAILVTSGTLAGLVAVLTYSGADVPAAIAAGPVDSAALGGPPPLDGSTGGGSTDPSASPTPDAASPSPSAAAPSGSPTKAAAAPTKAAAAPTKAAPGTKTAAATPTQAAAPTPTKAAPKPTPTPTKVASVAKDYTGSLITHKYGKVQVGIRVKDGKIIAVWPAVYPNGASQPYSDFSIPVLKSETMRAQGAGISNVSGATLTWQAWKSSLTAAMHKAGI